MIHPSKCNSIKLQIFQSIQLISYFCIHYTTILLTINVRRPFVDLSQFIVNLDYSPNIRDLTDQDKYQNDGIQM